MLVALGNTTLLFQTVVGFSGSDGGCYLGKTVLSTAQVWVTVVRYVRQRRIIPMSHGSVLIFQDIGISSRKVVNGMNRNYAPIEMSIWEYVVWLLNNNIVFVILAVIFILLTLAGITRIILEQCGVDCEVGFNWNGAGDFLLSIAFGASLLTLLYWSGFGKDVHLVGNMESNVVAKYGVTEAEHLERISKDTNVYRMEIFDDKSFEHGTLDFWFDAETGEPTNSLLDEHGVEEGLKEANALKVNVKK